MTDDTQLAIREKRRQELGETNFAMNQQGGALMQPRNGKELMDMANLMSGSGQMVRDFYRGNPGDCAALIMICQPYGFNPFMVSWKTYKASKGQDAPISFEGQLVNAMVNQSAPVKGRLKYRYDGEGPDMTCTVTGIDRETGEEITYTSPKVKDIPIKNSPLWKSDPQQQLGYFSARSWARRHFPELLLGVYTREEIDEAPIKDITPKPGGFAAKAQAARATESVVERQVDPEAVDVPDAEVLAPDQAPSASDGAMFTVNDLNLDDAFPGAPEYDEGVKAFQSGQHIADCPYMDDAEKATDWCGGWVQASEAAE